MSRSKKKGKAKYTEDDFEAFLKEVRTEQELHVMNVTKQYANYQCASCWWTILGNLVYGNEIIG